MQLNYSMFHLAHGYARRQMSAFVELQEAEFAAADIGFTAVKHQREVGTGYFDTVTQTIQGKRIVDGRAERLDGRRAVPASRKSQRRPDSRSDTCHSCRVPTVGISDMIG